MYSLGVDSALKSNFVHPFFKGNNQQQKFHFQENQKACQLYSQFILKLNIFKQKQKEFGKLVTEYLKINEQNPQFDLKYHHLYLYFKKRYSITNFYIGEEELLKFISRGDQYFKNHDNSSEVAQKISDFELQLQDLDILLQQEIQNFPDEKNLETFHKIKRLNDELKQDLLLQAEIDKQKQLENQVMAARSQDIANNILSNSNKGYQQTFLFGKEQLKYNSQNRVSLFKENFLKKKSITSDNLGSQWKFHQQVQRKKLPKLYKNSSPENNWINEQFNHQEFNSIVDFNKNGSLDYPQKSYDPGSSLASHNRNTSLPSFFKEHTKIKSEQNQEFRQTFMQSFSLMKQDQKDFQKPKTIDEPKSAEKKFKFASLNTSIGTYIQSIDQLKSLDSNDDNQWTLYLSKFGTLKCRMKSQQNSLYLADDKGKTSKSINNIKHSVYEDIPAHIKQPVNSQKFFQILGPTWKNNIDNFQI